MFDFYEQTYFIFLIFIIFKITKQIKTKKRINSEIHAFFLLMSWNVLFSS